ncbi:MAG: binding domain protein excisionase family [Nevskia sp.]|nr:binding domain protein excisionase family [Nevskia sp.]
MSDDRLYVTAKQAASALGVSLPTLYAYVSRKLIRSQMVQGTRKRRYWKADIDRLKGEQEAGGQADSSLGLINETKITLLTEHGLYYRGKSVIELAEKEAFESVAALLWEADVEIVFTAQLPATPPSYARLKRSLGDLSVFERANPRLYDLSKAGMARSGADLVRWYAAIIGGVDGPSAAPLHEFIVSALSAPAEFADIVRRLLILAADHEFDPTTFAVRAVANAGVTPCNAVMTGMIVSGGQRLQSGRAGAVSRLLEEVVGLADPRDSIVARFRNGEAPPGFGPPKSRIQDPRAESLMNALEASLGDNPEFKRFRRAVDTASEISGLRPDFILPATFVGRMLGLKGQELALASLGRVAGWIAHAMEQYHSHELIRPRAAYTGPLPA